MIHIRKLIVSLFFGIVLPATGAPNEILGQSQEQSVIVREAVAPVFPPLAVTASQQGTIAVDVQINAKGAVESLKISNGPRILQKVAEIAARRWLFVPTEGETNLRTVRLSFVFELIPANTASEELLPTFRPPYQVEIKARFPNITKYPKRSTKRK